MEQFVKSPIPILYFCFSKYSPQYLHFIAESCISSAQKGHFFIVLFIDKNKKYLSYKFHYIKGNFFINIKFLCVVHSQKVLP